MGYLQGLIEFFRPTKWKIVLMIVLFFMPIQLRTGFTSAGNFAVWESNFQQALSYLDILKYENLMSLPGYSVYSVVLQMITFVVIVLLFSYPISSFILYVYGKIRKRLKKS